MINHRIALFLFQRHRAEFYEDLAEAIEDNGDPVAELEAWAQQSPGAPVSMLYRQWAKRLETGKSLSQALVGAVPDMDTLIITAGEESMALSEGLRTAVQAIGAADTMRSAVLGALAKPAFWLMLVIALLLMFAFGFAPILKQSGDPSTWPVITQAFYYLAEGIRTYWYAGLLLAGVTTWWFIHSLTHWRGKGLRLVCDCYAPPYILYRHYMSAVLLVTLAALLQAGVDLRQALQKIELHSSPWLRTYVARMIAKLDAAPAQPAACLDVGLFGHKLMSRINNFARRSKGNFSGALAKVGFGSIKRTTQTVAAGAAILNVTLLLVVGAMVPGMLIAVFAIVFQNVEGF